MEKTTKRNTLICAIDEMTTLEELSRELSFAMKRVRMYDPKLSETDVRIVRESRDSKLLLYAEWTSAENPHDSKLRQEDEWIVSEISGALKDRRTEGVFDCNGPLEKCSHIARVVTRMYHSEPGRIIAASPIFDSHGERQTGVRITIRYIDEK